MKNRLTTRDIMDTSRNIDLYYVFVERKELVIINRYCFSNRNVSVTLIIDKP